MASAVAGKIVHIGVDSQFTQFAASAFEAVAPGANEYIILSESPVDGLLFPPPAGEVQVVSPTPHGLHAIRSRRWDCDLIVAHAMTVHAAVAFGRAPDAVVKMWSGWGYDYYDSGAPAGNTADLFGPRTRALVHELDAVARKPGPSLPRQLAAGSWSAYARRLIRNAAMKSDYFSAPVPTDERIFRSRFPGFNGQYSQLNYASDEDTFAVDGVRGLGRGILIGNSASPTNNHLEVLEILGGLDVAGRQIVVPLSYGVSAYRDAVIRRGTSLFGNAFVPLVDRMPLADYNARVIGCDLVIMNQRRQQGLGNIGTALRAGAAVFLDEVNPVYEFLHGAGAIVRTTAELSSSRTVDFALSGEQISANQAVLKSFWGKDRVRANVAALLERIQAR